MKNNLKSNTNTNQINDNNNIDLNKLIIKSEELTKLLLSVGKFNCKSNLTLNLGKSKQIISNNDVYLNSLIRSGNIHLIDLLEKLKYLFDDIEKKIINFSESYCCGKTSTEDLLEKANNSLHIINSSLLSITDGKNKNDNSEILVEYENEIKSLKIEIERLKQENKNLVNLNANSKKEKEVIKKIDSKSDDSDKVRLHKSEYDFYLGISNYYGVKDDVNYKLAYELFSKSDNLPESKYYLALMNLNGINVEKNVKRSCNLFKESSVKGHHLSTMMLAYLADNNNNEFGLCDIDLSQKNKSKLSNERISFKYYILASEQGSSEALFKLYTIYLNGTHGEKKDNKKAWDYLMKAIKINNNNAINSYGNHLYTGDLVNKDHRAAFNNFKKASMMNNLNAINSLGVCYEEGNGVEADYKKAFDCYMYASLKGHYLALSNRAIYQIKTNQVENNIDVYYNSYNLLIHSISLNSNGNKNSYYYLGFIYENGYHNKSLFPDEIQAYNMYKISSDEGHAHATTKIAIALYNGINNFLVSDKNLAIKFFEKASNLGDAEANNYLGLIYEQEHTLRNDGNKSVKYFKTAYEKGNLDAAFNLSLINSKRKILDHDLNIKNESINQEKINRILDKEISDIKISKSIIIAKENSRNENFTNDVNLNIKDDNKLDINLLKESSSKGNLNARILEKKLKTENIELLEKMNLLTNLDQHKDEVNNIKDKNFDNQSISTKH